MNPTVSKLDLERDNLLEDDPQGILILSKDQKNGASVSRKEARISETLSSVLLSSDAQEDRKGWAENQYKSEPLLTITVPTDFDTPDIEVIANYLHTGSLPVFSDVKDQLSDQINEKLFRMLKLADWFGIPSLIKKLIERIRKNFADISSQRQLLPFFKGKSILKRYRLLKEGRSVRNYWKSDNDIKTETKAYIGYLDEKLPQDVKEYIIYESGDFIAMNMHFGSIELMMEFGYLFPNIVSRYNSGKITIDVESSEDVACQMRELEICPYKFIYGKLEYGSSFIGPKDFLNSPFEHMRPSPNIYSQYEQYAVSNFLVNDKMTLPKTEVTPVVKALAIRRTQYKFQQSSLFNPVTNLQYLLKAKLLEYKDFIPNYLSSIVSVLMGNEYKCVPVYTCPFFLRKTPYSYVHWPIHSFEHYAILLTDHKTENSIIIDTKYPYASYMMEIDEYTEAMKAIDEYRFYLLGADADSIAVYDVRDLKEEKIFKPVFYDGSGNEREQGTISTITNFKGKSNYYVTGDSKIHSLENGKFIANIPFETKGELLEDYEDIAYGNYIVRMIRNGGIEIFSFEDFKMRLFPAENGVKYTEFASDDYPDYLFVLKSIPQEGKLIANILKGIQIIKSYTLSVDRKTQYSYHVHINSGKVTIEGVFHTSNKEQNRTSYEIKEDLSSLFPPLKPKKEEPDEKYLDSLATRLINSPVFTMEDVKLVRNLSLNFDRKNVTYASGEEKVKAKDVVQINRYPLSNGDIIFNTYIDEPRVKKIADTYKYCKFTDSFSKLNCECGGLIEIAPENAKDPKKLFKPRLVIEYGYSGYPEIWI